MKLVDFDIYAELLKNECGLNLMQDKTYLLESRLSPLVKKWGFENKEAMTNSIQAVPDPGLIEDILESMADTSTAFYRDMRGFQIFKDHLLVYMKFARAADKRLRIWSAAAAHGKEPYSIAMTLKSMESEFPKWKIDIVASDLSVRALELAKTGIFSAHKVQRGVPIRTLLKHFTQHGQDWHINADLKKMVDFKVFNLMKPMGKMGIFDIIFCRNVLEFFDTETANDVLKRMAEQLEADGFLILDSKESLPEGCETFEAIPGKPGIYVKRGSGHFS